MVLPTGGGKTSVFCHLAASISAPAVILVHRRELATQASNRLREFGVDFGFIMAGETAKPYARVQVASVQTLVRRKAPPAGLVIVDEAHLSTAESYAKILECYPHARILGVTATPWRLSGKPLAGLYDASIVVATPAELRDQGYLAPYVGFSYKAPDLSGVDKVGDDYNQGQAGAAMSAIVPNVVEQWKAHASHLSTVVFAVTVEHSQKLTAEFRAAGVRAEHLDGSTPLEARRAILARVDRGETRVLCNVGVAVEGLDIPRLKCCVLARPTLSLARAVQMMGRVRRPWNGETARIHDHAFVISQHGLPDADRDYSLTVKSEKPPSLTTCSVCLALYNGPACPACNHVNEPRIVGERQGLQEIHDAEQVAFSSDESAAPPARRTVDLSWTQEGRTVEGRFDGTHTKETQWGPRRFHMVDSPRFRYCLPGTAMLDRLFASVRPGDTVRVTYQGEEILTGEKTRKRFKLEVDRSRAAA